MRKVFLAGLMVAVAGSSFAAGMPAFKAPDTDYKTMEAGTYVLDPSHASVVWRVWHMGASHFAGRFNKIVATAQVDPKNLAKSGVSVTIDPASVDTGNLVLDAKVGGGEFFESDKYPSIAFKSTKLEVTDGVNGSKASGKMYGDLTLHGVTKPVVLDVVFNGHGLSPMGGGQRLGFSAKGMIKRSDFGISYGVPMVGDEVEFVIETEFTKAG